VFERSEFQKNVGFCKSAERTRNLVPAKPSVVLTDQIESPFSGRRDGFSTMPPF
jgi:hypothetical protein